MSIVSIKSSVSVTFASDAVDVSRPGKTKTISFEDKASGGHVTHKAVVLCGTFSLKERVKTLDSYKSELEEATSSKERLKRAVITLLVVGAIVGGIAAMVFGGEVGLVVGLVGLYYFMLASDVILAGLVLGRPIEFNIFFPITMPIFLAYYMATYESKRAKKVECEQFITKELASYVVNKKQEIDKWLATRAKKIQSQIQEEKKKLSAEVSSEALCVIGRKVDDLEQELMRIAGLRKGLAESYTAAQELLGK